MPISRQDTTSHTAFIAWLAAIVFDLFLFVVVELYAPNNATRFIISFAVGCLLGRCLVGAVRTKPRAHGHR